MKLFDTFARRGSSRGFHSAIITTFGVEFAAFEQVLLPQFTGSGAGNIVLLADPGMLALSLADGIAMPRAAGTEYVVHGVSGVEGVFHAKIVFQVGRDGARVVVGSANATSAGIAGNREVVTEVSCGIEPSPERAFVVAVWTYLADLVGDAPSPAHDALAWLETRTPWLAEARDIPAERAWALADDTRLGFFANGDPTASILDRFVTEIGGAPVSRLIVMSPYWDGGLGALRALVQALKPGATKVLIQKARKLFPRDAVGSLPLDLLEIVMPGRKAASTDPNTPAGRFSHAKLVIATADGFDHVLSGSANCTLAALGAPGRPGRNGEASVYRRLPAGTAEEVLKLSESLSGPTLDLSSLPPLEEEPPIPLEAAAARSPGAFETGFVHLFWRPPSGIGPGSTVELLVDPASDPVSYIEAAAWEAHNDGLKAVLDPAGEAARFARLRSNDGVSGLAIISRREALRQKRREKTSRGADRAANELGANGTLDFRWLEILTLLEKDDLETEGSIAKARRMGRNRAAPEAVTHRRLDYDEFINVRRPPTAEAEGGVDRNTLAGTSVDLMRTVLNELVGGGHTPEPEADFTEEELPDDELVGGGGPPKARKPGGKAPEFKPKPPPLASPGGQETKDTPTFDPRVYEKAVDAYRDKVRAQAEAGQLGTQHVLRLRLWLILLLSDRDKLACDGSNAGWPRLVFRVLLAFFGDPTPPIRRLAMDPRYDQLPSDFIEAWAAVLAALDALADRREALAALPDSKGFPTHIDRLDALVRARMGLSPDDVASPQFNAATSALKNYLARL